MNEQIAGQQKLDLINLIKLIRKWKTHLWIVFISALIFSFIFTLPFFMKPVFKATAIIYPVNITPYSEESPTEQLLQLLNSEDVKNQLITAFDLYKHYDIDTTEAMPRFKMLKILDENISVEKTEYESVEINVFDTDPMVAAQMCDSLTKYLDQKAINLVRERAQEILVIIKGQYDSKKAEMDSMENELRNIRSEYGIFDFENQVTGFSREYYKAKVKGNAGSLSEDKKNLEERGGAYFALKENLFRVRGTFNDIKVKYEQTLIDLTKQVSFHNNITRAQAPEKKDSPKRSIIMILFTTSVMMLAFIFIIYKEYYEPRISEGLRNN